MNGLVKRSDVIETAKKFTFTDEHEKRRYLDFLDYCLKETKTAYNVDAVVEELKEISKIYCEEYKQREGSLYLQDVVEIVRKGGVNGK